MVRRDREGREGGVGLYIKKYLNFTKVSFNDLCDEFKYVSVKFTINKKKYINYNYLSSSFLQYTSFSRLFERFVQPFCAIFEYVIFWGDLNMDLLTSSSSRQKFQDLLDIFNLNQQIKEPTRVNISTNSLTLIDVIITNNTLVCPKSGSLFISSNVSDHNLIYSIFDLPRL